MKNNYADKFSVYCNGKQIAVLEKHNMHSGKLVLVKHDLIADKIDAREYKTESARTGAITKAVNRYLKVYGGI